MTCGALDDTCHVITAALMIRKRLGAEIMGKVVVLGR